MPAVPVGALLKLAARYGPFVAAAVKRLEKLTPEQRQRVVGLLTQVAPRHGLRGQLITLARRLEQQAVHTPDPARREQVRAWLLRVRTMQERLVLAGTLPKPARQQVQAGVRRELDALVADLVAAETAGPAEPRPAIPPPP